MSDSALNQTKRELIEAEFPMNSIHQRLGLAYDAAPNHGLAGNIHEARYLLEKAQELINISIDQIKEGFYGATEEEADGGGSLA